MKKTLLTAVLLIPSLACAGEFSIMPQVGWNHYRETVSGTWRQEPLPYDMDNNAGQVGLQFGYRPASWLRFTAGYFWRETTGGKGVFIPDDEYKPKFGGNHWNGPHSDKKFSTKWETRMQGIILAIEPIWQVNDNWELFAQFGTELYASEFVLKEYCHQPKHGYRKRCDRSGWTTTMDPEGSNWSSATYYGAGVSYKNWTLNVYTVPDEQPTISGFNGSYGFNLGYRFTF